MVTRCLGELYRAQPDTTDAASQARRGGASLLYLYRYHRVLGEESSLPPLLQEGDRDQELSTSPVPALLTTREEGSTLCNVSVICVGNVGINIICRGRTVLVMSDMKARLTSRVVPPYTSYTGHTVAAAAAW